jgi:soluble P-type ATPase
MLDFDIPGYGHLTLEYLVSDYTGTLSVDGLLLPEIKSRLARISQFLKIHIVTADTFGHAETQLKDLERELHIIVGANQDVIKEEFVQNLGIDNVVALGNGNNDRRMLKAARLGIAVINTEGCSSEALAAADLFVLSAQDGLDLLLNPNRLKATLRF